MTIVVPPAGRTGQGGMERGLRTHTAGRLRLFPGRVRCPSAAPRTHPLRVRAACPGAADDMCRRPRPDGAARRARSARSAGLCAGGVAAVVELARRCRCWFGGGRDRPTGRSSRALRALALLEDAPSSRGWAARPARPAAPGRKPPLRSGCSAALRPVRVRPAAPAGLSGRSLPPTPAFPGAAMRIWRRRGGAKDVSIISCSIPGGVRTINRSRVTRPCAARCARPGEGRAAAWTC